MNTDCETPETKITEIVCAPDRDRAITSAKAIVRTKNPEVNIAAIDTWFVEDVLRGQ